MCDKYNIIRRNSIFCEYRIDRLNDSLRHTALGMMCRRHFFFCNDLIGLIIYDYGIRKCSSDIDSDPYLSVIHM